MVQEARARDIAIAPESDGRGELLDAVLVELRHLYGNVNTLFIHADKQVRAASLAATCRRHLRGRSAQNTHVRRGSVLWAAGDLLRQASGGRYASC